MAERPYVETITPCLVDTIILGRAQRGTLAVADVEREVRTAGLDLTNVNVRDRVQQLVNNGHLRLENDQLQLTDDGRQDIQKVLGWLRQITQQAGAVAR